MKLNVHAWNVCPSPDGASRIERSYASAARSSSPALWRMYAAGIADELHKREIVHASTARDQETGVCESGQELSGRSGIEDEDSIERLVRERRKDAHPLESGRPHAFKRPSTALCVGLDDDNALRADDFCEQRSRIAPATPCDQDAKAVLEIQEVEGRDQAPRRGHRRRIRRGVERERHVSVRERAEQLGQERFLPHAEERAFESVRAQKAEPLQLGDQVLSGPHLRRSPGEANDGLAKKLQ